MSAHRPDVAVKHLNELSLDYLPRSARCVGGVCKGQSCKLCPGTPDLQFPSGAHSPMFLKPDGTPLALLVQTRSIMAAIP
jgi:hypothetical protein